MRRLVGFVLIAFLAAATFAAEHVDRDALLAPDGTLYTVAPVSIGTPGYSLKLTAQKGDEKVSAIVPATTRGGYHKDATLAYDPEADTLFLFWQTIPAPMSSSLLVCAYHDGEWTEPIEFAAGAFRLQWNLRIAVTRYLDDEQKDGSLVRRRQSLIHAVWWEENGDGEAARYATLTVDAGKLAVFDIRNAMTLVEKDAVGEFGDDPEVNRDFLRQPAVFEHPTSDAVDLVFADPGTVRIHRVEVRPRRVHGFLRPPIGRSRGLMRAPRTLNLGAGRVTVIPGRPGSDSLIFYFESKERLHYLLYRNAEWSDEQTIVLNDSVDRDVAIGVMRKLLASE